MPANLSTLTHFLGFLAMSLPKSAGEPTSGVPPRSASPAFSLGSASGGASERVAVAGSLNRSTLASSALSQRAALIFRKLSGTATARFTAERFLHGVEKAGLRRSRVLEG